MRFTHPAGNQLRDLGAEVEDQDFLMHEFKKWSKTGMLDRRLRAFLI